MYVRLNFFERRSLPYVFMLSGEQEITPWVQKKNKHLAKMSIKAERIKNFQDA